ncbi:MAG: ABC transporter permease [Oscillospiraceae bacterium]|nr:ABC transporter permease [Oscillospiraceae bacterium]
MEEKNLMLEQIPAEKFRFVNQDERIHDKKFDDKPIGYFKDAWLRFKKSKASVVAAVIIILIVLYAFCCPLLIRSHSATFMANLYAKKPGRITWIKDLGLGIADGGTKRNFSERGLQSKLAIGVGAENYDGKHNVTVSEAMDSEYMPMIRYKEAGDGYTGKIDTYLEVGFIYRSVEQAEYKKIRDWEEETGLRVIYPLIADNEYSYSFDMTDANFWYKVDAKGSPIKVNSNGEAKRIRMSDDMVFEDNYLRDDSGNVLYYVYAGGGDQNTAQYKIRVLYYNYFQYLYGHEPEYILGTDAQGYDMALRLAGGIKLSLEISIAVASINFIIGTLYGAVEGYYGGTVDLIMERISDILWDIPFIVLASLFQIHLAAKVGPIPSLLFVYILTGWIGTAATVRTQFYRFKNQEYVMAAHTLGARDRRIIWKHIYPNTLGTIITASALAIPSVIYQESNLSYLGIVKLGSSRVTSLGTLLSDSSSIWTNYPHLMILPALTISLLMICFNLFGNGLRDAFNPALRGTED